MTPDHTAIHDGEDRCPICGAVFVRGVLCAMDVTEGICHAECLEDTPVVDPETGEPKDGPADTFLWSPWPEPLRSPPTSEQTDD